MKKTPEEFVTYSEGVAIIELNTPLDISGTKVKSLSMREPSVNDQLAADALGGSDAVKEIHTMANLMDLTPDDIKKLKLRDYKRVQAAYTGFLA
jgi:hypothetical protein